jgi:hypothetical protein
MHLEIYDLTISKDVTRFDFISEGQRLLVWFILLIFLPILTFMLREVRLRELDYIEWA